MSDDTFSEFMNEEQKLRILSARVHIQGLHTYAATSDPRFVAVVSLAGHWSVPEHPQPEHVHPVFLQQEYNNVLCLGSHGEAPITKAKK